MSSLEPVTLETVAGRRSVEDEADVVVIGTGAGGATAARVLAAAGLDVVVVEEGATLPLEARRLDAWSVFDHAWRDAGFQVARGRTVTPLLQGCAVGGSTPINGAIIHRLPEGVLETWRREHGIGEPVTSEAMARAFDQLDGELGVGPTPEGALGGNNAGMRKATAAEGLAAGPTSRAVVGCRSTGRCMTGCPTAQKRSLDETLLPTAVANGARLYATCRVERLRTEGAKVRGVDARFRDHRDGREGPPARLRARHAVVVAAGALHTPLLLRTAAPVRRAPRLGRGFQVHPGASVAGLFDVPVDMWRSATQGYEITEWLDEGMKMETVGLPPAVAAARLPGVGRRLLGEVDGLRHLAHWGVQVRARGTGVVRRGRDGRPRVRWSPTRGDVARLKRGLRRLTELMFAAGAREVLPGVHGAPERLRRADEARTLEGLSDDPRRVPAIASHLFGTAAMGPDRRRGVVDATGAVHGTEGLYVMDASCLPTNLGVNPQHTIAAVSWCLAERLADRVAG